MPPARPARMQLRFLPLTASAAGARSFLSAAVPRPVRGSRRSLSFNVANFSSPEKEGEEVETRRDEPGAEEARRRLAELDAQLEGLSEPKMRPPAPPPPPIDPYMDREKITGRGYTNELPEFSPTYVAFSTLALVILTIFTNVMFNLYVKPSIDGVDEPVRIQRVPLVDPAERQSK